MRLGFNNGLIQIPTGANITSAENAQLATVIGPLFSNNASTDRYFTNDALTDPYKTGD